MWFPNQNLLGSTLEIHRNTEPLIFIIPLLGLKWGLESVFLTSIPCCSELVPQLKFHVWGSNHSQKFLIFNPTPRWVKWACGEINKAAWVPWTYSPKRIFHCVTMPQIKQVPFYNLNFCFFYLDAKFKNQVEEIHRKLLQKVCKKKWFMEPLGGESQGLSKGQLQEAPVT